TTGVWARGVLQDEHGVDLSRITWVLSGDEHVAEYRPPANVVPIEKDRKVGDMLASGELAAAIGVEAESPDVKPLIPNALGGGLTGRNAAHPQSPGGGPRAGAHARPLPDHPPERGKGRAAGGASRPGGRRVQRVRRGQAALRRAPKGRPHRQAHGGGRRPPP